MASSPDPAAGVTADDVWLATDAHKRVLDTLQPILSNTWAIELPARPIWPALVFDIDSTPEPQWCLHGGYILHHVQCVLLCSQLVQSKRLEHQFTAAIEQMAGYMTDLEKADASYEPDPQIYARSLSFTLRLRAV